MPINCLAKRSQSHISAFRTMVLACMHEIGAHEDNGSKYLEELNKSAEGISEPAACLLKLLNTLREDRLSNALALSLCVIHQI